ncbi:MAG: hypothetical protein JF606_26295 [Burkholderiales bacterium]|nr:hypothetical protein [Burkholderiales bacterium]
MREALEIDHLQHLLDQRQTQTRPLRALDARAGQRRKRICALRRFEFPDSSQELIQEKVLLVLFSPLNPVGDIPQDFTAHLVIEIRHAAGHLGQDISYDFRVVRVFQAL